MSLSKLRSGNSEQSENGRRPSGSPLVPIACRVCNRTFPDNVSLVLHFEGHVDDGIRLCGDDLASLQSGQQSSSSRSPGSRSSLARVDDSHLYEFSLMNDCFRPRSLPANRKPTDRNRIYIPMMSAVPSMSPPIHNSKMKRYEATSSSTCPFMSYQLGARNSACGSTMAPHLQLREQNGGQTPSSDSKNPPISELGKPNQEIVILSDDDEEEDNKSAAEIDLTLKL